MVRALSKSTSVEPLVLGISDANAPNAVAKWGSCVHEHLFHGPSGFYWAPSMALTLEHLSPDVIDTQGMWMNMSRVALRRHKRSKTPLVVTPRGMLDPWAVLRSPWKKRVARWWFEDEHLSRAGAVRALNENEALAIRRFGVTSPVVIIPNGVEMPNAARVSDLNDRARILLFLGRLHPKKGLEPLLRAWKLVSKETTAKDWKLRVNGWGAPVYVQGLRRLVSDLAVDHSLMLEGPVYGAAKDAVFGSSAGFILPSFSEGLPMAVLEAWSWGTPVLMTRACNLPEGFSTGAAVEISTEPKEIARRILDYVSMSADDHRAMSAAGRRLVETRFEENNVARDLERLYGWLCNQNPRPSDLMFDG